MTWMLIKTLKKKKKERKKKKRKLCFRKNCTCLSLFYSLVHTKELFHVDAFLWWYNTDMLQSCVLLKEKLKAVSIKYDKSVKTNFYETPLTIYR